MPSEALAEEGCQMRYVYLLESEAFEGQRYVGVTSDLKQRLLDHNAGKSQHTSKYGPWRLVTYVAFSNGQKAESFERYLKSGSGHAFARKRLW
jgi:predicted GIY-YIG superfamily endonuclease